MQHTWKNIARNVNQAVNTSEAEQFLEILSLSYTHLPHRLRPCFLYMGGFPEDHEIKASKLIKCWVAEGFLKSNGSKDLEEVAEEYLEELANRSLILVIKKRSDNKIKAVKIHDLLRDLCLRKARDQNFLLVINNFSSSSRMDIRNSRRLSILSRTCGFPEVYGSTTRTILVFYRRYPNSWKLWKCFRLLRIMDAADIRLISFPDAISELFHLRYLALSFIHMDNSKFEVPGSLSELQNLQTLIFGGSNLSLPLGIWRMPRLRHLIFSKGFLPDLYDPNVLALENLHTLSGVTCFTWSLRIFKMIPNLKKLGIIYSSEDLKETGWSEYCLENLVHLHKLEKLKFRTVPYGQGSLFESIIFPRALKKLTLVNCGIKWKDMQIVGSLPNLEVLKLKHYACRGSKWETTEGEFCQLKLLLIDGADLSQWITESDHFPILERLVLYNCHDLRQIPRGIGEIPTLQLIEVDLRNLSVVESAKYIEEEQRSFGNDDLQVHLLKSRHWSK